MRLDSAIARARRRIEEALTGSQRPVIACSFGKDSLVLLDLCRAVREMDVLFLPQLADQFPEKYQFAWDSMQRMGVTAYATPPRTHMHVQDEDGHSEIYSCYGGETTGPFWMSMGCQPRRGEERFVCAADFLAQPVEDSVQYPWDVTFIGHKASDPVPFASQVAMKQYGVQSGTTVLSFPLYDWTDDEVWTYLRHFHIPYDVARYDHGRHETNPDYFPTCFNCLDSRRKPAEPVYCPKTHGVVVNHPASTDEHRSRIAQLAQSAHYLDLTCRFPGGRDGMAFREEWPLWSTQKMISGNAVYVELSDLPPLRAAGWSGLARLREEWIRLERRCAHVGIHGWVCGVNPDNEIFLKFVHSTGARCYHVDEEGVLWFVKVVRPDTLYPPMREMAKELIGARGAS